MPDRTPHRLLDRRAHRLPADQQGDRQSAAPAAHRREPVDPEHKGRGYEVAKGQYLIVEDEEPEAIEIESTHVIEIDSFVPRQQIDQRFFDALYYVVPNEPVALEAFAVIREAMRHKTMVARY